MGTTAYPGALDNFTDPTPSDTLNSATVPHAAQHANLNSAVEAVQATLGTNPQGTSSTVKDRIIAAEGAILNLNLAIDERVPGEAGSNAPGGALPNGYVWVNTTDNSIKVWNGTTWVDPSNAGSGGPTWAVVSGGTVTEYTHPTHGVMQVHTFTGNGTLTVDQPGYARVLIVGAGLIGDGAGTGGGGRVVRGMFELPAGSQAVVVGAGGTGSQNGSGGHPSSLGALSSGPIKNGSGAGGTIASPNLPLSDDITGTAINYAAGALSAPSAPNRGDGTIANVPSSGAGVVIVAVKKP